MLWPESVSGRRKLGMAKKALPENIPKAPASSTPPPVTKRRPGQRGPDKGPRKRPQRASADPFDGPVNEAPPAKAPDADAEAPPAPARPKMKLPEEEARKAAKWLLDAADQISPIPAWLIIKGKVAALPPGDQKLAFENACATMRLSENERGMLEPGIAMLLTELEFDPVELLLFSLAGIYGAKVLTLVSSSPEALTMRPRVVETTARVVSDTPVPSSTPGAAP